PPAQSRLDPCDKFTRAEGLGDVVVGSHAEPEHNVAFLTLGGDHDDRDAGGSWIPANGRAEFHAVHAGQHQVEQHQVRLLAPYQCESLAAVHGAVDLKALAPKAVGEHLEDVWLVLNYDNVLFGHDQLFPVSPVGVAD